MGVKELWTVLSPVSEMKSLWELQNKTVAVDLSAWICDSQNVGDNSQRNMYLRNLYFRTSFLLLLGVKTVFVLEGAAPELKKDVIIARKESRNGHKGGRKSGSRSRLKGLQTQCVKLLKSMGVSYIQADGEAEACCAWLNANNFVDAVITQDSDVLLYGATTVYRNFMMSPAYTCEAHDMSVIEEKLSLGRNKLLAISLLCGCDYVKGVNGVGKESAVKFLSTLNDSEVLDRLRSWRENTHYSELESKKASELTVEEKLELNIRKKALQQVPDFPSEDIIEEYLHVEALEDIPPMEWLQPNLTKFLKISGQQLRWEEEYAIEKFLPLVTRWHLLHPSVESPLYCQEIIKKRIVRGVKCFECKWTAKENMLGKMEITPTTTEPQDLVYKAYTDLVDEFLESKKKKTKKGAKGTTRKGKENIINNNTTEVEKLLHNLSIEEVVKKNEKHPKKKRIKKEIPGHTLVATEGLQTLDKFFKKKQKETFSDVDIEMKLNALSNKFASLEATNPKLSVLHSTPKRDNLKPIIDNNVNNVSYHYESDNQFSPSPLKRKSKKFSLNNTELVLNSSKRSLDVTDRWSLTNYLSQPVKDEDSSNSKKGNIPKRLLNTSMTESFLNVSTSEDIASISISEIIKSVVSNKNKNPL